MNHCRPLFFVDEDDLRIPLLLCLLDFLPSFAPRMISGKPNWTAALSYFGRTARGDDASASNSERE